MFLVHFRDQRNNASWEDCPYSFSDIFRKLKYKTQSHCSVSLGYSRCVTGFVTANSAKNIFKSGNFLTLGESMQYFVCLRFSHSAVKSCRVNVCCG